MHASDYSVTEQIATQEDARIFAGQVEAGEVMVLDADSGAFLYAYEGTRNA